jgi:hypothetical protein
MASGQRDQGLVHCVGGALKTVPSNAQPPIEAGERPTHDRVEVGQVGIYPAPGRSCAPG